MTRITTAGGVAESSTTILGLKFMVLRIFTVGLLTFIYNNYWFKILNTFPNDVSAAYLKNLYHQNNQD